ncbi:oxidoreductase [Brevundimonas sp. GCM10030266]|uniref:oxidoreductase n=1 Tax=Brevundimonas sp. GCM10030266 TaxID=3273386 RepID=UPI003616F703
MKAYAMTRWTTRDITPQAGRTAIVTGAGGLGFEDALELARAGADVILASRNPDKGAASVDRIRREVSSAQVRFEVLDLADLTSIENFASRLTNQISRLDILINNAGVMRPVRRMETADGFELQLGTNYLGHFALTGRLLPLLRAAGSSRVVTLSSVAARRGAIDFDDLQASRKAYDPMAIYSQSKLACLMFALELQRRSETNGWGLSSLAAHPGLSSTELLDNAPGAGRRVPMIYRVVRAVMMQPPSQGALPTLYAATDPGARPGGYYGPDGLAETRGHPSSARCPAAALDTAAAARLWTASENLTGVTFQ